MSKMECQKTKNTDLAHKQIECWLERYFQMIYVLLADKNSAPIFTRRAVQIDNLLHDNYPSHLGSIDLAIVTILTWVIELESKYLGGLFLPGIKQSVGIARCAACHSMRSWVHICPHHRGSALNGQRVGNKRNVLHNHAGDRTARCRAGSR